jgi:hypothetical protein
MDCSVLSFLIYRLDALLRQLYRIREFTDDPDCLLRLAMKRGGMLDFRLTTAKSGSDSAPMVRVEIDIRRCFVKLAFHRFDGCHPRRGAWGFCQQSGTGHDDGQSGEVAV